MIFGHAVIAWIFFPDFLLLQNLEFWAFEGPFHAKKTKKMWKTTVRIFVLHNTIKGDKIFWDESSFTFSVKGHVKHVSVKKDGATAVYLYSTFEGKLLMQVLHS